MSTTGQPSWIDLGVPDLEISKHFYSSVFGWTYVDSGEEFGHYHQIFGPDGRIVGGLMQNFDPADNANVFWEVYFATPGRRGEPGKAPMGGTVVVPTMQVGEMGTMGIATAPSSAQFGLWQAGTVTGLDITNTPGTPIWFDTPTPDVSGDAAFYQALFGWDVRYAGDDPQSGFATVGPYESAQIGLFDGTEMFGADLASQWRVFFKVANMDATVAAINANGGHITDGPEELPEESSETGRPQQCATVVDPDGAVFLIMD